MTAKERTAARARKRGRKPKTQASNEDVPVEEVSPATPEAKPSEPEPDPWLKGKQSEELLRWKIAGVCFAIMGLTYLVSYVGLSVKGL